MEEALSIAETNKIRKSLGLALLPEPRESSKVAIVQHEKPELNVRKIDEKQKKNNDNVLTFRPDDEQDDEEEEPLDTMSWLNKFRVDRKEPAKVEQTPASRQVKFGRLSKSYSEKDLQGLQVGHEAKDLSELGKDAILILDDQSVLDGGEKLISAELLEKEQLRKNIAARVGRSRHQQYEEDDSGYKKTVLSKYDEEPGSNGFVLGGKEIKVKKEEKEVHEEAVEPNNDILPVTSDYLPAKPVKFKKRKAKPGRKRRATHLDDDNDDVDDDGPSMKLQDKEHKDNENDDYLSSLLAKNRASKTRKILSPEEIAAKVGAGQDAKQEELSNGGRPSTTSDFLASIRTVVTHSLSDKIALDRPNSRGAEPVEQVKIEDDENQKMTHRTEKIPSVSAQDFTPEEQSLSGGIAAAMKLLQNRGVLKNKSVDEVNREELRKKQREWQRQLEKERLDRELRYLELKREEELAGSSMRLSRKEREELAALEDESRAQEEARMARQLFANYKPEVKLEYKDAEGNILSTKDAYKYLSHQFHGNSISNRKKEKQIQRREEELEKERRSIFDNTDSSAKKQSSAGLRLS